MQTVVQVLVSQAGITPLARLSRWHKHFFESRTFLELVNKAIADLPAMLD